MASVLQKLAKRHLLKGAPSFVSGAVQYEVILGSVAFGVSDDLSDIDLYGFCIPPRDEVFPHLRGDIEGFDEPCKRFEQHQQHHIHDPDADAGKGRVYDCTIYSIVKFFRLLMDNNPNIIDTLFVPRRCLLFVTPVGELVREKRHLFLHRGAWHRFKGYAYQQMHKMRHRRPRGKRKEMVEEHGYDLKFAYHIVRLLNEVEQILEEHDLDLERNRAQLKSIRRGEWTLEEVERYFADKERQLEATYTNSTLPAKADHAGIKALLLRCLEQHYGSLEGYAAQQDDVTAALRKIREILDGLGV